MAWSPGWSRFALALVAVLPLGGAALAAGPERTIELYGTAQADLMVDTGRVDPAWEDTLRPSRIGIDGQYGTDGQTSISVKQSRFGAKGVVPTEQGPPLGFKFEFDLFGTGADAGQLTFHLRYFWGEWGPLLVGQADSVFRDGDVFPNLIDYWGPPGFVDKRNPQLRWTPYRTTTDRVAIALEKPGNDVDAGNIRLIEAYQAAEVRSDEKLPDLTVQYRRDGEWGHLQVAGLVRQVAYEYRTAPDQPWRQGHEPGWGLNLAAAIGTVGRDRLLLQAVYGRGIATYLCDGGMDLAPTADPAAGALAAEAVPLLGALAYYDHFWSDTWSSSIGYSFTLVDGTNFQGPTAFHRGDYASANLLASPSPQVLLGGELLWGRRTDNDGTSGDDVRLQLTVKYRFGVRL